MIKLFPDCTDKRDKKAHQQNKAAGNGNEITGIQCFHVYIYPEIKPNKNGILSRRLNGFRIDKRTCGFEDIFNLSKIGKTNILAGNIYI